jgi:DNA-binding MarR family transcriptional regulator
VSVDPAAPDGTTSGPTEVGGLDPVIHPLSRLRICAMLSGAEEVAFTVVQQQLDLTPSSLSKQVATLSSHGYVVQRRGDIDSRTIWLSLTPVGRRAYDLHIQALAELAQLDTSAS